jgi:hypothetical protein
MKYALPWYVAVDDVTAGPAPTELVVRGIEHRKIPPEALVCEVGAARWKPLAEVDVFHAAVIRSYPPPPPDSAEARTWLAHGFHFPAPAPLPQFDYPLDLDPTPVVSAPVAPALYVARAPARAPAAAPRAPVVVASAPVAAAPAEAKPVEAKPVEAEPVEAEAAEAEPVEAEAAEAEPVEAEAAEAEPIEAAPVQARPVAAAPAARRTVPPPKPDVDVDVEWDDVPEGSAIDWSHPFESYFLLSDDVALPEERVLLESLSVVSRETLRQEGALWNLALCLAYGSDDVGLAAARAFFEAAAAQGGGDPIDWMSRTLMSKGFVPSGIPEKAGRRALERLRSTCPPALTSKLS